MGRRRASPQVVGCESKPSVDLRTHDLAVGRRMVVAAEQGASQVLPRQLEPGELSIENGEALGGDRLPVRDGGCIEHARDVLECQAGVLEHADEYQSAKRLDPIPALSGSTGIRGEQASAFVEPDGRRRHAGTSSDIPDGQQGFVHLAT